MTEIISLRFAKSAIFWNPIFSKFSRVLPVFVIFQFSFFSCFTRTSNFSWKRILKVFTYFSEKLFELKLNFKYMLTINFRSFQVTLYNEENIRYVTFKDFIDKELVLFSYEDLERSIPSCIDGFKPGQRKVIWVCFKRNDKKDVKVAQFWIRKILFLSKILYF